MDKDKLLNQYTYNKYQLKELQSKIHKSTITHSKYKFFIY
jgi:hypothetical protein